MTAYRRPFTAIAHDGGLHLVVGNRQVRLSAEEVAELADQIAGPIIEREITRITGVER